MLTCTGLRDHPIGKEPMLLFAELDVFPTDPYPLYTFLCAYEEYQGLSSKVTLITPTGNRD